MSRLDPFSLFVPVRFVLGKGTLDELPEHVSRYGTNVMLVSGPKHLEMGVVTRVEDLLTEKGLSVTTFAEVEADPSVETIERARDIGRENGVEVVIGLGGGSANDAAKAVAIALRNEGGIWQYAATQSPGKEGIKGALPMISIPTTSGTGTESTKYAVVTNRQTRVKDTLVSEHIFPKVAVIDTDLLLTMPSSLTATTGLDAFCQAMESYFSKVATPATDILALAAMRTIIPALPRAFEEPDNEEARLDMALGSLLGGAAIAHNGCIAPHAIAHSVGAHAGVHHGTAVAIVTPPVMEFNRPCSAPKLCSLAELYGVERNGMDAEEYAGAAIAKTREYFASMGIPSDLSRVGVTREMLPSMVRDIAGNISLAKNPRPMQHSDIERILDSLV